MSVWLAIWSCIKNLQIKVVNALGTRWKLILFLGLGLLCFILVVLVTHYNSNLQSDSSRELINAFKPLAIPHEELFLLDEPDFLPEILLEREPRVPWTAEDARPFWRDPLRDDPEEWRKRIKVVIDELLEGIP